MSGFEHQAPATWTVGQLRRALASFPDEMPVRLRVPTDPPGPDQAPFAEDYELTGANQDAIWWGDERGTELDSTLTLHGDWASGTYETGEEEQ